MDKSILHVRRFLVAIMFGGLCVVFLMIQSCQAPESTFDDFQEAIGVIIPDAERYVVGKNFAREGERHSYRTMEALSGGKVLKLEITPGLSLEEASQIVAERLNIIQSLFVNLPSPYPGMVTKKVAVPDKLLPQRREILVNGVELPLYILTSNSRHTYGAMAQEMAAFRGGLFFLFDETTGTLFRFDLFVPMQEFDEEGLISFFSGIRLGRGKPAQLLAAGDLTGQGESQVERGTAADGERIAEVARPTGLNLILIAFEPLGANHLSCYGYDRETSPNLAAFANEAYLFEDAISPSSWSLPVFMSWFTSLYPSQHKVVNKYSTYTESEQVLANLQKLTPRALLLAQILQQQGYSTAAFTGGASLSRDFGFAEGFAVYFDGQRLAGFDLTMPKSLDWLEQHQREKFFLFVQGYDVHGQFPLERQDLGKFLNPRYNGPYQGTEDEYQVLRDRNIAEGYLALSQEDTRLWRAVYDAKIYAADRRFGAFIEKLRQMELLDKSIIVVSSGSGNEYNEHGRIDHGYSLYEELIHVPLMIRVPGQAGRIDGLVRTIDIMPTVLDLLQVPVAVDLKKQMQGVSLVPLLEGKKLELDGVSETDYLQTSFKRALKTGGGWKFIISLDSEKRELYNLNDDPSEQHNLLEEYPRLSYELEQKLFLLLRRPAFAE